jgi:hypothetical protein
MDEGGAEMLADLAYLAEVVGAIAVVVSLFYVAS